MKALGRSIFTTCCGFSAAPSRGRSSPCSRLDPSQSALAYLGAPRRRVGDAGFYHAHLRPDWARYRAHAHIHAPAKRAASYRGRRRAPCPDARPRIQEDRDLPIYVVGCIDDGAIKRVDGVPVLGKIDELPQLVKRAASIRSSSRYPRLRLVVNRVKSCAGPRAGTANRSYCESRSRRGRIA